MCIFNSDCPKKLVALQAKYDTDTAYYDSQIKNLNNLLLKSISMPDLGYLSGKGTLLNPRDFISIGTYAQADNQYYTYSYSDWLDIISKVNTTFKANYSSEVFDCDNFSLMFSAMSMYSAYKSGFNYSIALGIAWSQTHAFNIFLDNTGKVWILEPQTGKVVGQYGKVSQLDYSVIEVWFMN